MTLPVFILAAGLGTRLRPLTEWLPKPLLPVGDRPALEHILARVRPVASTLVANAHHRAADLRAFFTRAGRDVWVSEEERILGTAGGLAYAADRLGGGAVLVWNGDIVSTADVARLVAAHDALASDASSPARAVLAIRPLACGEGNVGTDEAGRIVRLRRETTAPGEVCGGAFLGIHVIGAALRERLPQAGCLVGDVYLPALREGMTLRAFDVGEVDWHDIGTLRDYEVASFDWLAKRGGSAFVGEGAVVDAGVTLGQAIVGAGARVRGAGAIERCIVWPGTEVTAPLSKAVATPWGTVPLTG